MLLQPVRLRQERERAEPADHVAVLLGEPVLIVPRVATPHAHAELLVVRRLARPRLQQHRVVAHLGRVIEHFHVVQRERPVPPVNLRVGARLVQRLEPPGAVVELEDMVGTSLAVNRRVVADLHDVKTGLGHVFQGFEFEHYGSSTLLRSGRMRGSGPTQPWTSPRCCWSLPR
ncbi:hypothetical protein [Clavibacter phage 33]|nr:hypothetical protein [Clavibacter phage 33]